MANEWLRELRELGVKRAVFSEQNANGEAKLLEVEFFEVPQGIPRIDADTIVPPPPSSHAPHEDSPPNAAPYVPPAIQRILKKGSVS